MWNLIYVSIVCSMLLLRNLEIVKFYELYLCKYKKASGNDNFLKISILSGERLLDDASFEKSRLIWDRLIALGSFI